MSSIARITTRTVAVVSVAALAVAVCPKRALPADGTGATILAIGMPEVVMVRGVESVSVAGTVDADETSSEDSDYDDIASQMLDEESPPTGNWIDRGYAAVYVWKDGIGYVKEG